ncbi:MAG: hypothetical protein K0S78_1895 [Thermomicrobiales bacterium]|nr:hypothetical protein [Thermomicrobiales bacterium]
MTKRARGLIRVLFVALLVASSLQFAAPAQAKTFTVCSSGCDYTTIAAALQDADDGDTIAIGEGSYAGSFEVSKDITLSGAGHDTTTILGTNRASVIRVRSGANVTIETLTITGGGGSRIGANAIGGGGILNEGRLTVKDSVVRDNTVATSGSRVRLGGGIYSETSKTLGIFDSVIAGNRAQRGGGIFIGDGDVVIEGTTISGNQSGGDGGGIAHEGSETLRIERSNIRVNRSDRLGGGIATTSELLLVDSTVVGNTAAGGGGITGGNKRLRLVRSTVGENAASGAGIGLGGGITVGRGGLSLVDSIVENNQGLLGAGIFTNFATGDVDLIGSTVARNVAAADGGGIWNQSAEINLSNSRVIDNQAGESGGGIFVRAPGAEVKLRNGSVVAGNQPDQCFPADLKC